MNENIEIQPLSEEQKRIGDLEVTDVSSTRREKTPKKEQFWGEFVRFAIIAVVVVLPIRFFVAQPFVVSGASMEPTFLDGDYLIIDELSFRLRPPERGEVIIFHPPNDERKFYIKRVIGLPLETVRVEQGVTKIYNASYPLGLALPEEYIENEWAGSSKSITLGTSEYFVMGDNRPASSDSRVWGPLDEQRIIGRALLRLFPFTNISVLPGSADFEGETPSGEIEVTTP